MADLRGTAGSVTYAGSDGPTVTDIVQWSGVFSRDRTRVTRPGYAAHRYSYGPLQAEGTLRVVVSDSVATMPIPLAAGSRVTLTLLEISGQSYAFKASMVFLRKLGVDSANGSQQFAEYGWTIDVDDTSTVTVT